MRSNTDRKKEAVIGTTVYILYITLSAALLLFLRSRFHITGFGGAVLLIAALVDLGIIIPILINLHTRIKEIDGGEEDAAAQY